MFDIQTKTELKKGNPAAFKEVFRLLYPRLKRYCRLFFSDDSTIEDVIQDTFLNLWEKRNSLKPEQSVESLVFVMTRNACLNQLKKKQIELPVIDLESKPVTDLQFLYQLDLSKVEEKSLEEMLVKSLQKAIDELPEKMKEVFIQCKVKGKKQSEIAEELGISLKMVEKHIASAKNKLREKLIKQYPSLVVIILMILHG